MALPACPRGLSLGGERTPVLLAAAGRRFLESKAWSALRPTAPPRPAPIACGRARSWPQKTAEAVLLGGW